MTARAIIFNGTTQNAKATLPNTAPFTSLGAFKFVFKIRDFMPQNGYFFYIPNKFDVSYAATASPPRLDFYDGTNALQVFLAPNNVADIVGKIQFDPANSRWTYEIWKADGTARVFTTQALSDTTNLNFGGKDLFFASNEFNSAKAGFKLDWWYMQSGVDALNVFPGADATTSATILKYTFDNDTGDDSSGNSVNLTLFGSPTFADTGGGGGGGGGVTVTETFTASDGTLVTAHTSDSGHTWSKPSYANGDDSVIASNKATKGSSSTACIHLANPVHNANQYVQGNIGMITALAATNASLVACADLVNNNFYHIRHNKDTNEWRLLKSSAGVSTVLGTWAETLTTGDTRFVRLEREGTTLRAFIAGVERITATDSEFTTGHCGFRFSGAASTTTGYYIDNYESGDLVTGSAPTAPSNIILSTPTTGKVVVTWVDNSNNETSFRIERKTGVSGTYTEIGSVAANTTTYDDTTVASNTTYFYRVRSRNGTGDSPYATEVAISTTPSGFSPLRILSWNTQFNSGSDNVHDIDRTARWIAKINPDLAALCESPVEEVSTLVASLSTQTGITWYSHHVGKTPGLSEGNLILSKTPFISTDAKYLSGNRSVAEARVSINGQNINFFATHLDNVDQTMRNTETSELLAWASGFTEKRIIAGDFNGTGPTDAHIVTMEGTYADTWAINLANGTAFSYPDNPPSNDTRTRRARIDYIFISNNASSVVNRESYIPDSRDLFNLNVQTLMLNTDDLGVRPSDHNQVIADFQTPVAPVITSLSPTEKTAGDAGFTLTVNGSNFDTTAVVKLNGVAKSTTFVNSGQLTAVINTSDIATAATLPVTVTNSTGEVSNSVNFLVNAGGSGATISNINVVVASDNGAAINFRTNTLARGIVEYGTTAAYGNSTLDDTVRYYQSHLKILTGLLPSTVYHYRVKAINSSGVVTTSQDFNFQTPASGPSVLKLPQSFVDTRMPDLSTAVVRTVKASGGNFTPAQFQNALDEAVAATGPRVIQVDAGVTLTGQYTLGNKVDNNWIVVRSANHASLTQAKRVGPANVSNMFIMSSANIVAPLMTNTSAHHWRFIGAEITVQTSILGNAPDGFVQSGMVRIGTGSETSESQWPHHIIIDRCYVHGQPNKNTARGVYGNGTDWAVIDSYLSEFHAVGTECQAILSGQARRVKIENCYLEGAGENFMSGGVGHSVVPVTTPTDFEFTHNYVANKLAWKLNDATCDGLPFTVNATTDVLTSTAHGFQTNYNSLRLRSTGTLPAPLQQGIDYYVRSTATDTLKLGVRIDFTYTGSNTFTANAHGMPNGLEVRLDSSNALPSPLNSSTNYYVINQTANTFQLALSVGGAAITITNAGSGAHFVRGGNPIDITTTGSGTHYLLLNWTTKNLFEFKTGKYVIVHGNVFERWWPSEQTGGAFALKSSDNDKDPTVVCSDVLWYKNYAKNIGTGMSINGSNWPDEESTDYTRRLTILHNLFEINGTIWNDEYSNADAFAAAFFIATSVQSLGGGVFVENYPDDLKVIHNTFVNSAGNPRQILRLAAQPATTGGKADNLIFQNNVVGYGTLGIKADGFSEGTVSLDAVSNSLTRTFTFNLIAGSSAGYPSTNNIYVSDFTAVKFVNLGAGDYHLASDSPGKNAGSDGLDIGADIDAVQLAVIHSIDGDWSAGTVNNPPTVNAGADQSLSGGTTSTNLVGTAVDPDNDTLTYTWSKVSGPNNPTIVTPTSSSTTVSGLVAGTYIFRLSVSDGTNPAVTDDIQVTVAPASNLAPTVNAGVDKVLTSTTASTTLVATASDPEGQALTVVWSKVSGPNTPVIQSPTSLSTVVSSLIVGTYVFRVTVSDGVNTVFDDVQVQVNGSPIVNAGTDQNLSVGTTTTTLTGTASDPENNSLTIQWTQVSGPAPATIVSATSLSTNVTGLVPGTYVFRLSVNDGVNVSVTDDVQVIISANQLPVVNAGADQNLVATTTNTSVTATTSDPDGGSVSVVWSRLSGPNNPTIVSPTSLTTNITGLVPGVYVFRCVATDEEATTGFDDVTIRINRLPVINAGADQTLGTGVTTTTLTGNATDADGDTLAITWSRVSGPNTPTIISPNTLITGITGLVAGTYVFRLTVNDGVNLSVTDDINIVISATVDSPPVVSAGQTKKLPFKVTSTVLVGTVIDSDPVTLTWSRLSGPNTPTIATPTNISTTVSGLLKGTYVFRLTANDGINPPVSADVQIIVPYSRGAIGGSVSSGGTGGSVIGR